MSFGWWVSATLSLSLANRSLNCACAFSQTGMLITLVQVNTVMVTGTALGHGRLCRRGARCQRPARARQEHPCPQGVSE